MLCDRSGPRIYLVGGPSCAGKTMLATNVAERLVLEVVHVDELLRESRDAALRAACGRLDLARMPPEALCDVLIAKGRALTPLLHRLIAARREGAWRGVIEGEGIEPALALRWRHDPRVRCAFVIEVDETRLLETLRVRPTESGAARDMASGIPARAACMDALYGRWLRGEAEAGRLCWIESQPFETLADRYLAAVA